MERAVRQDDLLLELFAGLGDGTATVIDDLLHHPSELGEPEVVGCSHDRSSRLSVTQIFHHWLR